MKARAALFIVLISASNLSAQSFQGLLKQIETTSASEKQKLLDEYFISHPKIPVIENDTTVYFIYRGEARSVSVAGDATGWAPKLRMGRIEGTRYWYCKSHYENDARLEYKIVVNETDWMLDPLSKQIIQGGMGPNSELTMPKYIPPSDTDEVKDLPTGTCLDTIIQSRFLKENRPVRIYLPRDYSAGRSRYPVIVVHDGFEFFNRTTAKNILDHLVGEKHIQPMIAVFVQPVHRDPEYSGNLQEKYTQFITGELIPFMDQHFRTIKDAGSRATMGISNGGNISLWLLASHPSVFGKVAAMSSNVETNIDDQFSRIKCDKLKIYLNFGKYDLPVLVPRIQKLKKILEEKSCSFIYREYPEGHSWKFWQKHLPEALECLFPFEK